MRISGPMKHEFAWTLIEPNVVGQTAKWVCLSLLLHTSQLWAMSATRTASHELTCKWLGRSEWTMLMPNLQYTIFQSLWCYTFVPGNLLLNFYIHLSRGSLFKNRNLWWHSDYFFRSLVVVEINPGSPSRGFKYGFGFIRIKSSHWILMDLGLIRINLKQFW